MQVIPLSGKQSTGDAQVWPSGTDLLRGRMQKKSVKTQRAVIADMKEHAYTHTYILVCVCVCVLVQEQRTRLYKQKQTFLEMNLIAAAASGSMFRVFVWMECSQ